jgi:hypothetical protein
VSRATPVTPQVTRVAKSVVAKAPDRLPEPARTEPTRIEPAASPVTSALMIAPGDQASAEPELPKPVAPQPLAPEPAKETTVAALPAPAADPSPPALPTPTATQPKLTAAQPKPTEAARSEPAPNAAQVAALMPASVPLAKETGETGQLLARGNERMEIGDIAAARLLFELAAQSGSPVAATAMGRSYDPVYFIRVGVRGVKPDAAKAKDWYEKAVTGGDRTAENDLQNLTTWLTKQ